MPPLGLDLKKLAQDTSAQLTRQLGVQRERILFGGWDQGAIQIFWPGNLWNISEEPQTFTVWIEPPAAATEATRYGAGWNTRLGGTSSEGRWSLSEIPSAIYTPFFETWLGQFGITRQ